MNHALPSSLLLITPVNSGRVTFQSPSNVLLWCTTYVTTALYFGAVLVVSLYYYARNKKRLPVDKLILIVLILGLAEMVLLTAHYIISNRYGTDDSIELVVADLFGSVKTGTGRGLLVFTAFGGGLVRDFLIVPVHCIFWLCTFYTGVLVIHVALLRYGLPHGDDFSLAFDIFCGILDAYFILWSILAVTRVIHTLETLDVAKAQRFVYLRRWIILLPFVGLVPLKRIFNVDDDDKAEYIIISAVRRVFFLFMVVGLQCFLASVPRQHRSRMRVELPDILPAFKTSGTNRKLRRNSLASELDSYGADEDEGLIRTDVADDEEEIPLNGYGIS